MKENTISKNTNNLTANIISQLPNAVWWKDKKSVYQGHNNLIKKVFNLPSKINIIGKTDKDLAKICKWDKAFVKNFCQYDKEIKVNGSTKYFEITFPNKSTFLINGAPWYDKQKRITGIIYTAIDITKQKKVEQNQTNLMKTITKEIMGEKIQQQLSLNEQLEWIHSFFNAITARIPGYVFWKNHDFVYLGCNNGIVKLTGMSSKYDIAGKTDEEFGSMLGWDNHVVKDIRRVDQEILQDKPYVSEELLKNAEGKEVILFTNKTPIKNNRNDIVGILGVSIDITEHKKLEQSLMKEKEKAEQANQAKSAFLALMSHELRTPLNGILGLAQVIRNKELPPRQKYQMNVILQSGNHLLTLIDDVLDFSKLEAGKLEIINAKFDLYQLVKDTTSSVYQLLLNKEIKSLIKYDKNAPREIVADPRRVRQIIMNFISNAIKFTDKGHIKIIVKLNKKKNQIKISVEDTGIGISKNKQHTVFERFTQIQSKYSRKYGGTGLGLAICKELAEAMHGAIGLDSEYRKGSTFWFTIPLNLKASKKKLIKESFLDELDDTPIKSTHILLLEDNLINQEVAKAMVEDVGCTMDVIDNGREALKMLKKQKYGIVFTDVTLPGMSGLEVMQKIRAAEKNQDSHIPIIAVTAHVLEEDRLNCLKAGADDVLTKPIMQNKLKAMLQKWVK